MPTPQQSHDDAYADDVMITAVLTVEDEMSIDGIPVMDEHVYCKLVLAVENARLRWHAMKFHIDNPGGWTSV